MPDSIEFLACVSIKLIKLNKNVINIINCFFKKIVCICRATNFFNIVFSHNKAFFSYTHIVQPSYFVFLGVGSDVALEVYVIVLLYSVRVELVA